MTRRIAIIAAAVVFTAGLSQAADAPKGIGLKLQGSSVNIKADRTQGSGTVVLRQVENVQTAFVITAAHVVECNRSVQEVIIKGDKKQNVSYRDAQIVQEVSTNDGSRTVGDTRLDAKVLTIDFSRDIALLQVRSVGTLKTSAEFYKGKDMPQVGTEIYHCAAPGGQNIGGSATLTAGIISRTGVRIPDFGGSDKGVFDQTDSAAMGGSSGGMICLRGTGEWIGMITLGLQGGDSFHWFVPVRNVRDLCQQIKCEWFVDGTGIDNKALEAIPLEVSPKVLDRSASPPPTSIEPPPTSIEHALWMSGTRLRPGQWLLSTSTTSP